MSGVANVRRYLNEGIKVRQKELWIFCVSKMRTPSRLHPRSISAARGLEDKTLPPCTAKQGSGKAGEGGRRLIDSGMTDGGI